METTIIAGGRDFVPDIEHLDWLISTLLGLGTERVLSGMAKGADTFGARVAKKMGIEVVPYPAEWNKYGKMAGKLRNVEMAKNATSCILFPGGAGTKHMENTAYIYHLKMFKYEKKEP